MDQITNPHDKFFKELFARRDTVEEFLRRPEGHIRYEEIQRAIEEVVSDQGGESMRTIADSLIERGMQQGLQEGRQEGRLQAAREAVLENLEARFEIVPRSIVKRIDEIEEISLLKALQRKSAVVDSLEQLKEVLEKLLE